MTIDADDIPRAPQGSSRSDPDNDPAHRDWIPLCWSGEAREIAGAFRFGEHVKPWNWLELDANEAEKLWSLLFGFVAYFNQRYGTRIDKQIPPCWSEHGPIVEELTTLMFARWHTFESPSGSIGGAQYWHSYTLPAFYDRVREWLGDDLLACQQGWHRDHEGSVLKTATAWTVRSEGIAIMDVALRTPRTSDVENAGTSRGVDIPFLDQAADTRKTSRLLPNA